MRKTILIITMLIAFNVACKKDSCEPKKELTKAQLDSIFRTKLIMKK